MHAEVSERALTSRCKALGEAISSSMAAGVALLLLKHPEESRDRVDAAGDMCAQRRASATLTGA